MHNILWLWTLYLIIPVKELLRKFTDTCSVSSNVFRTTTHGTMHKPGKPEINSEQWLNNIVTINKCDSRVAHSLYFKISLGS